MKLHTLVVEIYEPDVPYPVVVHVFCGKTRDEAQHYYEAHMQSDAFLRACETTGLFRGNVKCRTKKYWTTSQFS